MKALVFILSLTCSQTLLAEGSWTKTTQGCDVWNEEPQPNEISTWTGPCIDGRTNGYGVLTWESTRYVIPAQASVVSESM